LHSPVGLDLGTRDPASIALAIAAELQATASSRSVAVSRLS
jgi:xanthine/CO dehydrogenase XdhC/CoxF family maturation factor